MTIFSLYDNSGRQPLLVPSPFYGWRNNVQTAQTLNKKMVNLWPMELPVNYNGYHRKEFYIIRQFLYVDRWFIELGEPPLQWPSFCTRSAFSSYQQSCILYPLTLCFTELNSQAVVVVEMLEVMEQQVWKWRGREEPSMCVGPFQGVRRKHS